MLLLGQIPKTLTFSSLSGGCCYLLKHLLLGFPLLYLNLFLLFFCDTIKHAGDQHRSSVFASVCLHLPVSCQI